MPVTTRSEALRAQRALLRSMYDAISRDPRFNDMMLTAKERKEEARLDEAALEHVRQNARDRFVKDIAAFLREKEKAHTAFLDELDIEEMNVVASMMKYVSIWYTIV